MTPDPRLLVPATRALLEGWCGPVVTSSMAGAGVSDGSAVLRVDSGERCRVVGWSYDWYPLRNVFLDLSRAECRDRVARVVLVSEGHPSAPAWWYRIGASDAAWALHPAGTCIQFMPSTGGGRRATYDGWGCPVPALADLDPNDDTRLPDGSRLVDALALAAVARHVLGGTP